jgi:hypothetical protein
MTELSSVAGRRLANVNRTTATWCGPGWPRRGPTRSQDPVTATGKCFLIYIRLGTMISLHKLDDVGVVDPFVQLLAGA